MIAMTVAATVAVNDLVDRLAGQVGHLMGYPSHRTSVATCLNALPEGLLGTVNTSDAGGGGCRVGAVAESL